MFNPAKASENIKNEFVDYIATTHSFADEHLQKQFINQLKQTVSKGPLLEINDVFKTGKSINQLIDKNILSPLFRNLEMKPRKRLPLDCPLYLHQEQAIKSIVDGNNVVISTGTGSGKTNCFLIPVINELLREQENGTLGAGVRAMFIYPMNALANDQMKNIRSILMDYPNITFGVYNGGTENDEEKAIAVYKAMFATEKEVKLRDKLPNEILSRDEMKKNPPNILFTNYAMLEHLLFRPKDDVLFSNADFRFVVLDEAHVYTGATGIETSILLRRLRARISSTKETQFILTSATLGSDESADNDIITFANNLCGVSFYKQNIIRSQREIFDVLQGGYHYPNQLYCDLANDENIVWQVLNKYGISADQSAGECELLYDFVQQADLYIKMRRCLANENTNICSLDELSGWLNLDLRTAISFISLCTRAQKNGKSLIGARYHFFVRSLEGCYLAFSPNKKLFLTRQTYYQYNDNDYAVFEIATCGDCGHIAFVGKEQNRHLVQVGKLQDSVDYFYLADEQNDEVEEDDEIDNGKDEEYYLCPHCGSLIKADELRSPACDCNQDEYIKVVKAHNLSVGARCGNCHRGNYFRFYLGNEAATGVLATALYEELPEIEYEDEIIQTGTANIFAKAMLSGLKKCSKRTGRQFLTFSDSRQEAAKFACYMEKSYDEFLRRRGICQIIKEQQSEMLAHKYSISDFVKELTSYFSTKKSFAKSNVDESNLTTNSKKNAWVAMLNELVRYNSPTSLTSLGMLQFRYKGNTPEIIDAVAQNYHVNPIVVRDMLDMLVFEIVKAGAIMTDNPSDIDDNDREYIFYTPSQNFIKLFKSANDRSFVHSWLPKAKENKKDEYHKNHKIYYICKCLNISEKESFEFLQQYYSYLTDPTNGNAYCMDDIKKDGTFVMPARYFDVLVVGHTDAHWYRCKKCGKYSQFCINGHCSTVRCDGEVEEIDPIQIGKDNHFAKLYLSDRMSPLFIKEHTAQLSKKESAEYQEQFIKKEINALSCSTTFEMGVDVGDLETVFLRDVPPLPSNYAQRAGRAGRSVNAAAYALTFAKLSSHDLSFFREPKKMINGTIKPPLFKVDNEKIVRRHIYAVALSMFFAEHEDLYNYNDAQKFINEKGYQQFIDWLNSKPQKLTTMLERSIPNMNDLHKKLGINDYSWINELIGVTGVFTQLINEYERNVETFEKQIKLLKRDDVVRAAMCERKLRSYQSNKLIDFLARGNILPRYGFPVDTVELQQNTTADNINKLRLCRDLQIAIAEYAPSSEVIADGRMYTSRYIKKSNIGTSKQQDWHTAYIAKCNNDDCQTVNYSITPVTGEGIPCIACGALLKKDMFFESIEPRSGFVTERKDKDVPLTKQEKNYKSEDYYIGNKESKTIDKHSFLFNDIQVDVESTTNDSLMVKSASNFYVCEQCGYAVVEDESIGEKEVEKQMHSTPQPLQVVTEKSHESLYGQYPCGCHKLVRRSLHHVFNTDVAKISFSCATSDKNTMLSVMYAILYSVTHELNIERRDIKACLSLKIINSLPKYSIVIYDAVPGGAGHSRRLVTNDGKTLYSIFMAALQRMNSCDCSPSCYNCLRSYENQNIHDLLDRKSAAEFLQQFVGDIQVLNNNV